MGETPPRDCIHVHLTVVAPSKSVAKREEAPEPTPSPWNLVWVVFTGTLVFAWIMRYTPWFEAVASVLALGGVLSWTAFVIQLLPKSSVEEFQSRVVARVLKSKHTIRWCVGLIIGLFFASCSIVTVNVENVAASETRVEVGVAAPDVALTGSSLALGRGFRSVALRGGLREWLGYGPLVVSAAGYEAYPVRPGLWDVSVDVSIPHSFVKPVVLIYPSAKVERAPVYQMQVSVEPGSWTTGPLPLNDQAYVLGGAKLDDQTLNATAELGEYRELALREARPDLHNQMEIAPEVRLSPGQRVHVKIRCPDGKEMTETHRIEPILISPKGDLRGRIQPISLPDHSKCKARTP